MQQLFTITSEINFPQSHLMLEINAGNVIFTVLDTSGNTFTNLVCTAYNGAEELDEILSLSAMLKGSFKKTDICWGFAESVLMPNEFFKKQTATEMPVLVYGNNYNAETNHDFLYKHNMYNVYTIPSPVYSVVKKHFPYVNCSHLFSVLPECNADDGLYAVFYFDAITVMLKKNKQVQLIKKYSYKTPEDAAFHLLNVCRGFAVDATTVALALSGMIDEKSALYAELYKYFLHINFQQLPDSFLYIDEIKNLPPHFFSYLFSATICV
jgi:hypothetical protein